MKFLDALAGKNTGRPPVWLMRQAGRYLPEYRALRAKWSLKELFFTPELAAQVTLMPIEKLGVDAAILFSDITITALALGLKLDFKEGPVVDPLVTPDRIPGPVDPEKNLSFLSETIRILRGQLKLPLIGFCGAPFTVATYLAKDYEQWPEERFLTFLDRICEVTEVSIRLQVEAGAQAIQIFDSWANKLTREQFLKFSAPYLKRLVAVSKVPTIVFMRQAAAFLDDLLPIQSTGISFDGHTPLNVIRQKVGPKLVLQGNIEPDLLYAPIDTIRRSVRECVESMEGDPAFILNLGHGVKPDFSVEAVKAFVNY